TATPGQWDVSVTGADGAPIGSGVIRFIGNVPDPTANKITVTNKPPDGDALSVVLDFSVGVTSFSAGTSSTIRVSSVDGNDDGNLTKIGVDDQGHLELTYSNTKTSKLGEVAIAGFSDPQKLEQLHDGLFRNTGNSEMQLLTSGAKGTGTLVSKQI